MSKRRVAAYIAAALVAGLALGSIGIASAAQNASDNAQSRLGIRLGASIREAGATLADIVAELTGSTAEEVRDKRSEGESFAEIFFGNCVANGIPCVTALPPRMREPITHW